MQASLRIVSSSVNEVSSRRQMFLQSLHKDDFVHTTYPDDVRNFCCRVLADSIPGTAASVFQKSPAIYGDDKADRPFQSCVRFHVAEFSCTRLRPRLRLPASCGFRDVPVADVPDRTESRCRGLHPEKTIRRTARSEAGNEDAVPPSQRRGVRCEIPESCLRYGDAGDSCGHPAAPRLAGGTTRCARFGWGPKVELFVKWPYPVQ